MRGRRRFGVAALGAAALLWAGAAGRAQAGLIVSNLGQPFGQTSGGHPFVAQSFTAGGADQTLGSVTLRLQNVTGSDVTVTVNLFDNTTQNGNDVPGSSLLAIGSVPIPAHTTSFADHTLSAPAFTLQANTTYWLEAEGSSGIPVEWAQTLSTTTTGPGTLGSWADTLSLPNWLLNPTSRLQLEVDSAPVAGVPEPSGLALLAAGGAGLLGWRARRRAAA
jgi:hypothetical protein